MMKTKCDLCGQEPNGEWRLIKKARLVKTLDIENLEMQVKTALCPNCCKSTVVCRNCFKLFHAYPTNPAISKTSEFDLYHNFCQDCKPKVGACDRCEFVMPLDKFIIETQVVAQQRQRRADSHHLRQDGTTPEKKSRKKKTIIIKRCPRCVSSSRPYPQSISPMSRTIGGAHPTFKTMPIRRKFGFEIECMSLNGPVVTSAMENLGFGITTDGSVGGSHTEVQTPPLRGDEGWNTLVMALDALQKAPAVTDASCGLHMHIETCDLKPFELVKVFTLYYAIQKHLFSMQTNRRRSSHFCIRLELRDLNTVLARGTEYLLYPTRFERNDLYRRDYKMIAASQLGGKGHDKRYMFLNLHSHYYRGTIENRMHMNSLNLEEYYNWLLINGTLIEYAKNAKVSELAKEWTKEAFLGLFPQSVREHIVKRWRFYGCAKPFRVVNLKAHLPRLEELEHAAEINPDNPFAIKTYDEVYPERKAAPEITTEQAAIDEVQRQLRERR